MKPAAPSARDRRRGVSATVSATKGAPVDAVVEEWGCVPYDEALQRQLALHARRTAGAVPDTLVLVSHPATFTLGRHAPEADIVLDRAELLRRGIAVARSDRGGRATYHGPGQVVLYPIVSVADLGLGVKDWVCLLESALIDTLGDYGVKGQRQPGTAGIWTAEDKPVRGADSDPGRGGGTRTEDVGVRTSADSASGGSSSASGGMKIASLGLRVSRGVSYHGVALNTGLDASVFDCIVTCGVRGERVTTIAAETGSAPDDREAGKRLAEHVARRIRDTRQRRGAATACDASAETLEPGETSPNGKS